MADWLKQLTGSMEKRKDIIVLHGVEGSGKSSFAGQFPGATFMMSENETGIVTLKNNGLVPDGVQWFPQFSEWSDVMDCTRQMIDSDNRPRTLVIDTGNGIESLLHRHIADTLYDGRFDKRGFMNYQEGYKSSIPVWREWLALLDQLRHCNCTVIMLCHTAVTTFKNPEGPDYDRYVAEFHKETWGAVRKFADMIVFLNFHDEVTNVDNQGRKGKAKGGRSRVYNFVRSSAFDAKHRHNLPAYMDGTGSPEGDFKQFCALLSQGKKQEASA